MSTTSQPTLRLIRIREASESCLEDLSALHAELLTRSPVALLGPDFMRRFYYRLLADDGLIFGHVAYVDDKPAAFVAATHDAAGFMGTGLRRHPIALAWTLFVSLALSPRRLAAVWEAWRLMRSQPGGGPGVGEILSLGVRPAFRDSGFVRRTGLRLAADLVEGVMRELQDRDVRKVRAVIDRDNKAAQLFYHGLGWRLGAPDVEGWRTPSVEFLWEPDG